MKKVTISIVFTLMLWVALVHSSSVHAAENGIGHYSPGAVASFIDAAPPGLAPLNQFNYYNGSFEASRQLPIGGLLAAGVDAVSYAEIFGAAYTSPYGVFGGKFSAAMLIPYVWADVKGTISGPLGTFSRKSTADGIGDIVLVPFWLGWTQGDFKWDVRLDIYAPTGEFNVGQLANVGLNYWTFEPVASFSYLSKKTGLEFTTFAGFDFNTKNDATNYQSGDVFHIDATVAEHLPLFGYGTIGIGANAFYWKQFTADSGSGARLGSFEGRTQGIGPVISYISPPVCGHTILAEVKWLPELDVKDRLSGDYVWFKLVVLF